MYYQGSTRSRQMALTGTVALGLQPSEMKMELDKASEDKI